MKKLALLLFLASAALARSDDNLLQNGDFSDGITHWDGDCHTADYDSDTVDLSAPSPSTAPAGVVVKLRSGDWTKVIQEFDGKAGDYLLTIVYSTSSDLTLSDKPDDYVNIPEKIDFSRLRPFSSPPGKWVVIVNDLGDMHYYYWEITPNPNAPGNQKLTLRVKLKSGDEEKKGFYLLFPPGQGVITLHSISLVGKATPDGATASPTP